MSISRRTLLLAAGGLTAGLTRLSACGSDTGRPGASTAPSGSSAPDVSLTQWYHEYGEDGVQDAVKRYAAAYPDAKVTVKWTPGDYEKAVSAALLTADVPDVFEYGNGPTLDMIKAGQVVDLTDVIGDQSLWPAPVLEAVSWEGKVYAIPQTIDMQMLYYRKSLLEKAGLQPPQTLDELAAAAKALGTKDIGGFFAGNDGGVGVLGQMFIWAAGKEQINSDGTDIDFADDAVYAALKTYAGMKGNGLLESASNDWYAADPFVNEETAMQWGGLWSLPDIQKALGDDFGVLPFPAAGASGKQSVPFGAFSSTVSAKGKNVDAAKAFVKWLWVDNEADQVDFSNSYGTHIPAKLALVPQADKLATGAGAEAAKFVADFGKAPAKLWTPAIQQAYAGAVSNILTKGADPAKEIAAVSTKAKADLKRVNG